MKFPAQFNRLNIPAFVFLFCLVLIESNAQSVGAIITLNNASPQLLNVAQLSRYNKIQADPYNASLHLVNVNLIGSIQQSSLISLQLPGKDCIPVIKAKQVESFANGDFSWYGEVRPNEEGGEQCSCLDGAVTLTLHGGELVGNIIVDEDTWSLNDLTGGKYVLAKRDLTNYTQDCGTNNGTDGYHLDNPPVDDRTGGNCPVKVLALYTQKELDNFPDVVNRIRTAIFETNQALRNSHVLESELMIIINEIRKIDFDFVETDNMETDINILVDKQEVKDLRAQFHADIVLVFTHSDHPQFNGLTAQAGPVMEKALAIVNKVGQTPYTTAHEIAHMFGCRHEFGEDDSEEVFQHAFKFIIGSWPCRKDKTTIVVSQNKNRVLHYSNPNVKYSGSWTGHAELANNARQLRANACTVADFMPDQAITPFFATISGDLYGCPCQNASLHASGQGGIPGPYQFEWYISNTGFNWGSPVSTADGYVVELPCAIGDGVYVKLKGTSSDGQVSETFRFIETQETWPGQEGPCMRVNNPQTNIKANKFSVFPNPATDALMASFEFKTLGPVDIIITDATGRTVRSLKFELDQPKQEIALPVEHLSPGVYFIQTQTADFRLTRKFSKL